MVTTFYPPYNLGGDGVFVQALSEALVERGHRVDVVHCEDAYRLQDNSSLVSLESDGIAVHRLKSNLGALSPLITQQTGTPGLKLAKLKSILNRNYDVVNFHNISLIGGPKILTLSKATVSLYTLHEHWLLCPTHIFWKNARQACDKAECISCSLRSRIPPQLWRYTSLIKDSLKNIDLILSPSQYTAKQHQDRGIGSKIEVLPTFSRLAAKPKDEYQPGVRPRFLFVGRITASKGIHVLLENFVRLKEYDLFIAGDGDLKLSLSEKYAKETNIHFLGSLIQIQLIELWQTVTATILSSLAPEVFPLTILESFACGVPVVARDAGGSREAIDLTGRGIVYHNRAEFYRAVHLLGTNNTIREEMAQRARAGYENYYRVEHYLDSYLAMIDSIQRQKIVKGDRILGKAEV